MTIEPQYAIARNALETILGLLPRQEQNPDRPSLSWNVHVVARAAIASIERAAAGAQPAAGKSRVFQHPYGVEFTVPRVVFNTNAQGTAADAVFAAFYTQHTEGYCDQGSNCVCGGDTQQVRERCGSWVKPDPEQVPQPTLWRWRWPGQHWNYCDQAPASYEDMEVEAFTRIPWSKP